VGGKKANPYGMNTGVVAVSLKEGYNAEKGNTLEH
jgi:hypothetical protein